MVNRHDGDIRVESEPGDTRFQIVLPLDPEKELESDLALSSP